MSEVDLVRLESEMLSGDPFTYMRLSMKYSGTAGSRAVDRMIQKLRRKGKIAFKYENGTPTWRATVS